MSFFATGWAVFHRKIKSTDGKDIREATASDSASASRSFIYQRKLRVLRFSVATRHNSSLALRSLLHHLKTCVSTYGNLIERISMNLHFHMLAVHANYNLLTTKI